MTRQPVNESSVGAAAVDRRTLVAARSDHSCSRARSRFAVKRSVALAVVGVLLAVHFTPALAKTKANARRPARGDRQACVQHYYKAKESIEAGRLLDAKEPLGRCARATCGSFLQQECTALYIQMENDVPSVVPVVSDAADTPDVTFEVKIDGELLTSKLDGVAIAVNPGWHEFTFSAGGRVFATQKVLLAQGQRNHAISVSQRSADKKPVIAPIVASTKEPDPKGVALQEADAQSASEIEQPRALKHKMRVSEAKSEADSDVTAKRGASWVAYALGGLGLVGVGGAGLFTYWGRTDNVTLRSSCAPECNPASVHHVRMVYLAADVSAAVGVTSLIASTWLFLHSTGSDEKPPKETARLRMLDLRPSASGAVATIGGTF
jgi:hypothetical protein